MEDYPDQTDCIEEFLKNKLGMSRDEKDVRKAIDALLRRGFTYGQVRQALNNLDLADAMEE